VDSLSFHLVQKSPVTSTPGFVVYKAHDHPNEELIDPIIYVPVSALPKGRHPTRILVNISAPEGTPWEDH
jgi:hypothetical protein